MVTSWPCEQPAGGVQVAVSALVSRDGRVLVVRRAKPPAAGKWSLPGGHVLMGEGLHDAVRRELNEETALAAARVGELLEVAEIVRRDARVHYLVHVYRVDVYTTAEAHAGDDAAAVAWVDRQGLTTLETTAGLSEFLERHRGFG